MDREQEERQFLGFFGIVKESIKIIFTWQKIFSEIALAFVLPLTLVGLAHIHISAFLFAKITPGYTELSDLVTLNTYELLLFTAVSFVLVEIFSILCTSTAACTTACAYTSKSIPFGGVTRVLPKVSKRLMITDLWSHFVFFAYIVLTSAIFSPLIVLIHFPAIQLVLFCVFLILYFSGLEYVIVILSLAGVVSVVEDIYGIDAMFKSKNLIKGKLGTSIAINLLLTIGSMAIQTVYCISVVYGNGSGFLRFGVAILCFLFLFTLLLVSPIVQTVFYFVCKSYHHENIDKSHHHENIDKSPLADDFEVHLLAEYLPPKADNV